MGFTTTVTLDDDVLARVTAESKARGVSFEEALNELVRQAAASDPSGAATPFRIEPFRDTGFRSDLNYDCTAALLDAIEGSDHQ